MAQRHGRTMTDKDSQYIKSHSAISKEHNRKMSEMLTHHLVHVVVQGIANLSNHLMAG